MTDVLTCDVLVVGSGAGGLAAALSARDQGLDVLLIEKDDLFGGTTAHSEGMVWIPLNDQAAVQGKPDSADAALAYLEAVGGNFLDRAKSKAYVEASAAALRFIEHESRVRYALAASIDYFSDKPGATVATRSLKVEPMDGKTFGALFKQIRPPLASTLGPFRMTLVGADVADALKAHRSIRAFWRMTKLAAAAALDRLRGRSRGTRIGNGHALVASLVEALIRKGVRLEKATSLERLITDNDRVVGAMAMRRGQPLHIHAGRGVVLATGGFSNDRQRQKDTYPPIGDATPRALLASPGSNGSGIAAATNAAFTNDLAQPAAWTPASLVPQPGGGVIAFPHYIDRNKPGFIAVDADGRRFTNEAAVYVDFVSAMLAHCKDRPAAEAWLIADARAVDHYGIGAAPPFPLLLGRFVRNGYLRRAGTLEALALAIGVPPLALVKTVERMNAFARSGRDEDFRRGESAYERACGDPSVTPNPSLGELSTPPFYAVKIVPSDIGTFAGLRTDADARVLGEDGAIIPGLYAVGNDAASAFGGVYPAAGITVGLALTFGYLAGRSLAATAPLQPTRSVTPVT